MVGKFDATSVTRGGSDWIVCAEVEGASARDANREVLNQLRRVERFFEYVSEGTRSAGR
jgi:hypothetical protein